MHPSHDSHSTLPSDREATPLHTGYCAQLLWEVLKCCHGTFWVVKHLKPKAKPYDRCQPKPSNQGAPIACSGRLLIAWTAMARQRLTAQAAKVNQTLPCYAPDRVDGCGRWRSAIVIAFSTWPGLAAHRFDPKPSISGPPGAPGSAADPAPAAGSCKTGKGSQAVVIHLQLEDQEWL